MKPSVHILQFILFLGTRMLWAGPATTSIVASKPVEAAGTTALSTIYRPLDEIRKEKSEAQAKELREQNETYRRYLMYKQIEKFHEFNNQNLK